MGSLWLVDEKGEIIIHPEVAFIGKGVNHIVKNVNKTDIDLSFERGNYLDAIVLLNDEKEKGTSSPIIRCSLAGKNGLF